MEFLGVSLYQPDSVLARYNVHSEALGAYISSLKDTVLRVEHKKIGTKQLNVIVVVRERLFSQIGNVRIWVVDQDGSNLLVPELHNALLKEENPQFDGPIAFALQFGVKGIQLSQSLPMAKDLLKMVQKSPKELIFPEGFIELIWNSENQSLKKSFLSILSRKK